MEVKSVPQATTSAAAMPLVQTVSETKTFSSNIDVSRFDDVAHVSSRAPAEADRRVDGGAEVPSDAAAPIASNERVGASAPAEQPPTPAPPKPPQPSTAAKIGSAVAGVLGRVAGAVLEREAEKHGVRLPSANPVEATGNDGEHSEFQDATIVHWKDVMPYQPNDLVCIRFRSGKTSTLAGETLVHFPARTAHARELEIGERIRVYLTPFGGIDHVAISQ